MAYWDYNEVLTRMLLAAQTAQPECDTREGSLIYTAVAPVAAELAQAYIAASLLLENTFADSATRDYLIRRAAERGITPYQAVAAQYVCSWVYETGYAPLVGIKILSSDGLQFSVVSVNTTDKTCVIVCDTNGAVGNGKTGAVVPLVADHNFTSMSILNLLVVGEDEESTEHLRSRYFSELESIDFGGSVVDYKNFTNEIAGVGAVDVVPIWNGGGTVKVIIADAALQPPTQYLIDTVQATLDPLDSQGQGYGIAPIGHTVTVVGAEADTIDVSAYFIFQTGFSFANTGALLQAKLNAYLDSLNTLWENKQTIVVRASTLISEFLSVTGVLDVQNVLINGAESTYIVETGKLAGYGTLTDVGTGV